MSCNALRHRVVQFSVSFIIMSMLLSACAAPPPQVPAAQPTPIEVSTASSVHEDTLIMVAAADLPETAILTDTLLIAQVGNGESDGLAGDVMPDLALGPRSAFPTLPPGAMALLNKSQVPSGVQELGNVYLNSSQEFKPDQVVVLSSKNETIMRQGPDGDVPASYIKPTTTGKLTTGAAIAISQTVTFPDDWEVGFRPKGGESAECVDIIQCLCLWCGCCVEVPTAPPVQNCTFIMVAAADLSSTDILTNTLLIAQVGNAESGGPAGDAMPDLALGPLSAFPTLPPGAMVLLDKSQVPSNVRELGNVYLSCSQEFEPDQVIVLSSEDETTTRLEPEGDEPVIYIKPTTTGELTPDATIGITQTVVFPEDLEVGIKGMTVDPIQWFCILCGCCFGSP